MTVLARKKTAGSIINMSLLETITSKLAAFMFKMASYSNSDLVVNTYEL